MSRNLERYLKILRGPDPDAGALTALESAMQQGAEHTALISALKSRLQIIEEQDGPQPISLSLRKRVADALMARARLEKDDNAAGHAAVEAMELFSHELNDVDALKEAARLALIRHAAEPKVRDAVQARLGGADMVLKELKRALKAAKSPVSKAGLAYASALFKDTEGDRDAALVDLMRAVRARPQRQLYVDELVRFAMETDRKAEAEAVLAEVATEKKCPPYAPRGYVFSKLGLLRTHLDQPQAALDAFMQALALDGELKGAAKQARKLADKLGVVFEMPQTAVEPPEVSEAAQDGLDGTPAPAPLPPPAQPAPVRAPGPPLGERTGTALLSDMGPGGGAAPVVEPLEAPPLPEPEDQQPDLLEAAEARGPVSLAAPRMLDALLPDLPEVSSSSLKPGGSEVAPFAGPGDPSGSHGTVDGANGTGDGEQVPVPTPEDGASVEPTQVEARMPVEAPPPPEGSLALTAATLQSPAIEPTPQVHDAPVAHEATFTEDAPPAEDAFSPAAAEISPAPHPAPSHGAPAPNGSMPAGDTDPGDDDSPVDNEPTQVGHGPQAFALPHVPALDDSPTQPWKQGVEEDAALQTVEACLKAGEHARAAQLLTQRFDASHRLADALMLADLYEKDLAQPADALQMYSHVAQRLAKGGDAADPMLSKAVEGAVRTGMAAPAVLLHLLEKVDGKVSAAAQTALVRAAAAAVLTEQPTRAAGLLLAHHQAQPSAAAELYEEADAALGLAGDQAGQAELRRVARERSTNPRDRLLLSRERADLLRMGDALVYAQALKDVLEDDPADGAALEKLLVALDGAGARGPKAGAMLEESLALAARLQRGEGGLPHLRRLARMVAERGERKVAMEHWREVLARRPGDSEALVALTELLEGSGTDAQQELHDVLHMRLAVARHQKHTEEAAALLARLAELEGRRGKPGQRMALLQELLAVDPENEIALQAVENHLEAQGDWQALAALLEKLAERRKDPAGRRGALLSAAELHRHHLGDPARARALVKDALRLGGDNVSALILDGELAVELGQPRQAVEPLRRAAELQRGPLRAVTLTLLGRVLGEKLDDADAADHALREALAADGGHRPALEALLGLAERTGRSAEARKVASDIAAMEPDPTRRASALLGLARAAREANELEQAIRLYEGALSADPADLEAAEELSWLLVARGDGRRARPLLEKLVAARGTDGVAPPLLVSLAKAQWASGETTLAKEQLRAALRRDPAMLEALRALADLMLADRDDPAETLGVLDLRILHHGDRMDAQEAAFVHARAGLLRRQLSDAAGAIRSLRRALALMPEDRPDPDALGALALLVEEQGDAEEAEALYARLARRVGGAAGAAHWVKVGQLARAHGRDDEGIAAFQEARRLDPERADAARFLMEAEVARGNGPAAVAALTSMLQRETHPHRQADLHVELARIHRDQLAQDDQTAVHLRRALELQPTHRQALEHAEQLFMDRKDARGLVGVYTTGIRNLPPDATNERVELWEKVALLRRYELKDLPGAVSALEAVLQLDDGNAKAREDLARIHQEMGAPDKALAQWRALLAQDPLNVDAYRGMLTIFRRQMMFDSAWCVGATLSALEEADDETRSAVRSLRPPFPTWPRPAADAEGVVRRLLHPGAMGPARDLLAAAAPYVLNLFSPTLQAQDLSVKNLVDPDAAPQSFALAAKHAARLLGLSAVNIYRSEHASSAMTVVLGDKPGLLVSPETLKGGMTPERAFSFARGAALTRPEALLVTALGPVRLRHLLEALVSKAQPTAETETDRGELDRMAREVEGKVPPGEWPRLLLLARDWWRLRKSHALADLAPALHFSADRVGFLFAQDLAVAVSVLKANGGGPAGVRAAIRELVLFSVSQELFSLRGELGPSVNAVAAARVYGDA